MRDAIKIIPGSQPTWRDRAITLFRRHDWRGFVRLYNRLKPAGGRREIQVRSRYGTNFLLTPWDSVDNHVLREGFYESEVLEAVRPALREEGAVLWVIGANFGLHAVTAKFLHPNARVLAFEPSPMMAARLVENSELNNVMVELHAYALADSPGVAEFFANASGNPGSSTLHPTDDSEYDQRFYVAVTTAADVITRQSAPPPTAMIVDAERAELEVLRGFGSFLHAPTLRRLVFEAPNELLAMNPASPLLTLAQSAGFVVTRLERQENTGHAYSNFLAIRSAGD